MPIPLGCMMKGRVWPFQQHSLGSCCVSTYGSGGWIRVYAGSYRVLITTQMELLDYKQSSPCIRFLCHVKKSVVHSYFIIIHLQPNPFFGRRLFSQCSMEDSVLTPHPGCLMLCSNFKMWVVPTCNYSYLSSGWPQNSYVAGLLGLFKDYLEIFTVEVNFQD